MQQPAPPDSSPPAPNPWPQRLRRVADALPTAAVTFIAIAEMGGRAFLTPAKTALGSTHSEAMGHLWGLWSTTRGLWQHGPLLRVADVRFPQGFKAHLMDPINLLIFAPVYALAGGGATGATLAWNVLLVSSVLLGAWGCWRIGRQLCGDHPAAPWGIAVMTAIFCATPGLIDFWMTGRSEMLPKVLLPLQLSYLVSWLEPRGPGVRPRYRDGMAAGLLLGAMVLGGWYMATFLLFLEIPLALLLVRGLPLEDAARRLTRVTVLGLLCAAPAMWALLAWPAQQAAMAMQGGTAVINSQSFPVTAMLSPLRVVGRSVVAYSTDHPPYVGVVSLALCAVALFYGGKKARPWLAVGLWGVLLSLGPLGRFAPNSHATPDNPDAGIVHLPAYLFLKVFPVLSGVRRWSRMAPLVAAPIAIGAYYGFLALAPRDSWTRRLFGAGVIAAILVDQATFPVPVTLDRPSFVVSNAALKAALETIQPGPIIMLPFEMIHQDLSKDQPRGLYLLWQLEHGRPVSTGILGDMDATLSYSYLSRVIYNLQVQQDDLAESSSGEANPTVIMPAPNVLACASADAQNLRANGFVAITLQTDLSGGEGLDSVLTAMLGQPAYAHDSTFAWELGRAPLNGDTPRLRRSCTAPSLRFSGMGGR